MKKINLFLLLAFVFSSFTMNAQFIFKLSYDFDLEKYTVSVIPQGTYVEKNQNITSDGQVTIKAPTNKFIPVDIESHLEGMTWENNARVDAPEEAPDFDYVSFALQIVGGIAYPEYLEGVELPLFSFKNAYGCQTDTGNPDDSVMSIIDNETDDFMPPNSVHSNVGNSLGVLGAISSNYGYAGLYNGGSANCDPASYTSTAEELGFSEFRVFPNPVTTTANVEIQWDGDSEEAHLKLVDAGGKTLIQEPVSITNGKNTSRLDVSQFPSGSYFLYLVGEGWEVSLDKINKQK